MRSLTLAAHGRVWQPVVGRPRLPTAVYGRLLILAALLVASAGVAVAQRAEWQVGGVAVVTGSEFTGAGLGFAWRMAGRLRIGLAAAVGETEARRTAGRAEGLFSYHFNPVTSGIGAYAGGGLAVTATEDDATEYLVVLLGLEGNPVGRVGWFAEAGVSGGVRLALGLRVRSGAGN